MAIKLFIDNDYSDVIFSDIVNKQFSSLIVTSNMIKLVSLANRVHAETTRIFGDKDKYKKRVTDTAITLETPISTLLFTVPFDGESICGSRVYSIVVDDFTHIPKDFLKAAIDGYCAAITDKVDITFYTNDVTNVDIYNWIK